MKIQDVRVHLLDTGKRSRVRGGIEEIPNLLPTRFRGARADTDIEERSLVPWLRVIVDDDLEGSYFLHACGETTAVAWASQLATYWRHLLIGQDPLWREYLWQRSQRIIRFHVPQGPVYFDFLQAIDIALWDLAGKAAGMSVAQLLGQWRDRIPAYCRAGNLGPEAAAEAAVEAKAKGYFGYKDHSFHGPKGNIEVAEALRAAVGPDWLLMHDPVEQYSLGEALYVGRELERLKYYWLEEPFRDYELGKLKWLSDSLDLPILALEKIVGGVYSVTQFIEARACESCVTASIWVVSPG